MGYYSYTTQDSGGDPYGWYQLTVFVYPDDLGADEVTSNEVVPGLIDACEQAYNESSVIDYWEVAVCDTHVYMWEDCDPDQDHFDPCPPESRDDVYPRWRDHLDGKDLPAGAHLLIEDQGMEVGGTEGGKAESDGGAWFDVRGSVYGPTTTDGNFIRNISIQEAFHSYIHDSIPEVEAMIEGDEHQLGQVYQNWWNDTLSPMLSSYLNDYANTGDCQSNADWDGDYTQHLSSCTVTALDETAQYRNSL